MSEREKEIEVLRKKMIEIAEAKGILHEDTIKVSQELDILIMQEMRDK